MSEASSTNWQAHQGAQRLARTVLEKIASSIAPGITERQLAAECEQMLRDGGADSFWYHGIGALVLVGERTLLSVAGSQYQPTDTAVQENDLVTIDLSPEIDGCWGDCARSFVVPAEGLPEFAASVELGEGIAAEQYLHSKLIEISAAEVSFEQLWRTLNGEIEAMGYENLDFMGNLGHTIERHIDQRRYIESGCSVTVGDVGLFTFEPHIRAKTSCWGFKYEDIYHLEGDRLSLL